MMKIALIGNMNNNHFSTMRYLRDLGYDAHLFLFRNEGMGSHDHFRPVCDTFEIDKWTPFIHQTDFYNGSFHVLLNFFKVLKARKMFKNFDALVGNSFAPFIALLAGKRLNIFLPHAIGGEWLGRTEVKGIKLKQKIKNRIHHSIQYYSLKKNTDFIGTFDLGKDNLFYYNKYGLISKVRKIARPMVYFSKSKSFVKDPVLTDILPKLEGRFPIVFSHISHLKDPWIKKLKGNDIVIKAFAKYLTDSGNFKSLLVMLEYGNDVQSSKDLVIRLGVEDNVLWVPKMYRKHIYNLMDYVDIGANEMGGYIWGGTGWEFIAKGVPFMHNIGRTPDKFKEEVGYECPDIFHVKDEDDIVEVLINITNNPELLKEKSESLKTWFSAYNKKILEDIIYHLKN